MSELRDKFSDSGFVTKEDIDILLETFLKDLPRGEENKLDYDKCCPTLAQIYKECNGSFLFAMFG